MAINDLFQALQMFQQGVQQYAITGAVNDANAQMQQLNQAQIDEGQKRQQLQQLANGVALKLTGVGASGQQIQSAFNAINPQNFGSVEQMQLEGQLAGNQYMQDTANKILSEREAKKTKEMATQYGFQAALQDKKFQQELFLEQMKLAKQAAGKGIELRPEDVAFETNVQMGTKLADQLTQAVNESGTWEAGNIPLISNKKNAAIIDAAPYQLAITYAKIVDPASVAREGEVAAAQKYMLNLGMFSSKEKALEGIANMKRTMLEYKNTRSSVKGGGAGQPAAGNIQVRVLPDGSRVKVRQVAPGKYEEVK